MRFIIIKNNFNDIEMLINVLKSFLGNNIKYEHDNDFLIIYHCISMYIHSFRCFTNI